MRLRLLAFVFVPFIVSACGGSPAAPTPAAAACTTITLSSTAINQSAGGGATSITVTAAPANCTWTATSNNAFMRVTSQATNTGSGSFTFTTDPNTGNADRNGSITVGTATVAVTQAGVGPPFVFTPAAPPNGIVGRAYTHNFATATGGTPPITYSLDSGGFAPNGLILSPAGVLAGTPTARTIAPLTFGVCAVDGAGNRRCGQVTMSVADPPTTPGDNLLGAWGGQITLTVGCTAPLPQTYNWTGTIRRNAAGGLEVLLNVPSVLIFNEVWPVTLNGQTVTIIIDFDSTYRFTGTLSADNNSITNGAFVGGNCNVPPVEVLPRGNWNGTRR